MGLRMKGGRSEERKAEMGRIMDGIADERRASEERKAEMGRIMDGIADERRALIAELHGRAEEAKRKAAECEKEIAAIEERIKERHQRMADLGH